jgi:hypothetical protein
MLTHPRLLGSFSLVVLMLLSCNALEDLDAITVDDGMWCMEDVGCGGDVRGKWDLGAACPGVKYDVCGQPANIEGAWGPIEFLPGPTQDAPGTIVANLSFDVRFWTSPGRSCNGRTYASCDLFQAGLTLASAFAGGSVRDVDCAGDDQCECTAQLDIAFNNVGYFLDGKRIQVMPAGGVPPAPWPYCVQEGELGLRTTDDEGNQTFMTFDRP